MFRRSLRVFCSAFPRLFCAPRPIPELFAARYSIPPVRRLWELRWRSRIRFRIMTGRLKTDSQGNFEFDNVPFNNYHVTATAAGFQSAEQDTDVRSPIPLEVKFALKIGTATTTVTVETGADLVETDSTHAYRRRPRPVRQAAARKPVFLAQFAGDAGLAGSRGRLERPVSRARRSRVQLLLPRRPADYGSAKQSLLQSDPGRRRAVDGSDRRRASGRIWRQDQPGDRGDHALGPGHDPAARRYHGFLRHVRHHATSGFDLAYGGTEVGQLHLRQRARTPAGFWMGRNSRSCTIMATKRTCSTASIQAHAERYDQLRISASRVPGSRRRIPTTRRTRLHGPDRFVRYLSIFDSLQRLGSQWAGGRPHDQRSKIRTFNIAPTWTHAAERQYGFDLRRFRSAGSIQLLSERGSFRRSHSGSATCRPSARIAG